jgi:hypothetical protein
VEFDFFELHEMAPENVAMVLIKYLQALPEPIYSSKYEAHFKLALGTYMEVRFLARNGINESYKFEMKDVRAFFSPNPRPCTPITASFSLPPPSTSLFLTFNHH